MSYAVFTCEICPNFNSERSFASAGRVREHYMRVHALTLPAAVVAMNYDVVRVKSTPRDQYAALIAAYPFARMSVSEATVADLTKDVRKAIEARYRAMRGFDSGLGYYRSTFLAWYAQSHDKTATCMMRQCSEALSLETADELVKKEALSSYINEDFFKSLDRIKFLRAFINFLRDHLGMKVPLSLLQYLASEVKQLKPLSC